MALLTMALLTMVGAHLLLRQLIELIYEHAGRCEAIRREAELVDQELRENRARAHLGLGVGSGLGLGVGLGSGSGLGSVVSGCRGRAHLDPDLLARQSDVAHEAHCGAEQLGLRSEPLRAPHVEVPLVVLPPSTAGGALVPG
eukprot:scaffold53227_cov25-Phaeocystis_antarctica.AAC.1